MSPDAVHHFWFGVIDDWAEGVALMHTNRRSGALELHEYLGKATYGEIHRDIIARFGRFPHRNEVLGRTSTAQEIAYLNDGGQRFGQQHTGHCEPIEGG
ncbi:MAG: hypothetical protein ACI8W7_000990 [Gammaproteobacteria bacterium]